MEAICGIYFHRPTLQRLAYFLLKNLDDSIFILYHKGTEEDPLVVSSLENLIGYLQRAGTVQNAVLELSLKLHPVAHHNGSSLDQVLLEKPLHCDSIGVDEFTIPLLLPVLNLSFKILQFCFQLSFCFCQILIGRVVEVGLGIVGFRGRIVLEGDFVAGVNRRRVESLLLVFMNVVFGGFRLVWVESRVLNLGAIFHGFGGDLHTFLVAGRGNYLFRNQALVVIGLDKDFAGLL